MLITAGRAREGVERVEDQDRDEGGAGRLAAYDGPRLRIKVDADTRSDGWYGQWRDDDERGNDASANRVLLGARSSRVKGLRG